MEATQQTAVHTARYLGTLTGRDKAARIIQFFSKYLVTVAAFGPETSAKLAALSDVTAKSRKVFRAGKFLEFLLSAQKSASPLVAALAKASSSQGGCSIQELLVNLVQVLRTNLVPLLTTVKHVCYAMWMYTDTLNVLAAAKVLPAKEYPSIPLWIKRGLRMWLVGLLASIAVDSIKMKSLLAARSTTKEATNGQETASKKDIASIDAQIAATRFSLVQASVDTLLPIGSLSLAPTLVSPARSALAGTITAAMGAYTQWNATA